MSRRTRLLRTHRLGAVAAAALVLPFGGVAAGQHAPAPTLPTKCVRVPYDINHDVRADAVIGQAFRISKFSVQVGAVNMLLGAPTGLTTTGNQYVGEETVGTVDGVAPDDQFGLSTVDGFFNSDCYADVAIGVPGDDGDTGAVVVIYGGPNGLDTSTAVKFSGDVFDLGSDSRFGTSLAAGDFNGDGKSDLAIGAPAWSSGTGGVGVLYGSTTGLTINTPGWFGQGQSGVPGTAGPDHEFGFALAAAEFTGDGLADLAIGAPGDNAGTVTSAGTLTVLHGSSTGLSHTGGQLFTQDTPGVPDTAEPHDGWAESLAAGDITGDGKADLVVGDPGEAVGTVLAAGSITVLPGAAAGVTATGSQEFDEDTSGVPGAAEQADFFGLAVSVGDYNGDGHADVAAGAPGESVGTVSAAGSVTVLYGAATGLTVTGVQAFSQGTAGVQGAPEDSDQFGASLWSLDITNSGRASLIIGVPGEDSGGFTDNGAVAVLLGGAGGLTTTGNQFLDATMLIGGARNGAFFGMTTID
jgi:hypothetical protein